MFRPLRRLAISIIGFLPAGAYAEIDLTFCYDPYPPYTLGEEGEPEGGTKVRLLAAVVDRIDGVNAKVEILPWKRCQAMARSGEMDGILPLFKNEERASYLAFSDATFLQRDSFWFLRERFPEGLPGGGDDFNAVGGLRLGMLNGGFINAEMEAALSASQPILRARDVPRLITLLQKQRVDMIAISDEVGQYIVRSMGLAAEIVPAKAPVSARHSFFGLSKATGADKYLADFNRVIAELHQEGEIARIQAEGVETE